MSLPVLGIDAALRCTGLCLLDERHTKLMTVKLPRSRGRDYLRFRAREALDEILPMDRLHGVLSAVVEFPPETEPRGRGNIAATLGFAAGVWASAVADWAGIPEVFTCPVYFWRKGALGGTVPGMLGKTDDPKALAIARAQSELVRWGISPANDNEAEAYCIARWGQLAQQKFSYDELRKILETELTEKRRKRRKRRKQVG